MTNRNVVSRAKAMDSSSNSSSRMGGARHKGSLHLRGLLNASGKLRTCNSLQCLHLLWEDLAAKANQYMASRQPRKMVQVHHYNQVQCNMDQKSKRRIRLGSTVSSMHNTLPASYMEWRSHKVRRRGVRRIHLSHSTGSDLEQVLRQWEPSLEFHKGVNITLQGNLVRPARQCPSSHSKVCRRSTHRLKLILELCHPSRLAIRQR